MNTETIHQQCARRKVERVAFRSMADDFESRSDEIAQHKSEVLGALIVKFKAICVDQALARLPENATFELKRQVIREAAQ